MCGTLHCRDGEDKPIMMEITYSNTKVKNIKYPPCSLSCCDVNLDSYFTLLQRQVSQFTLYYLKCVFLSGGSEWSTLGM